MDKKEVLEKIMGTKKYGSLYRPTVERVVTEMINRYPGKQVLHQTKKKLHQIWGAYFTRPDFKKLLGQLDGVDGDGGSDSANSVNDIEIQSRRFLNNLLMLQTSTYERIPLLDTFYQEIFRITGEPEKIIEPACGVNALTYPWMKTEASYVGFDVDRELIDFINDVYRKLGIYPRAQVRLGDVLLDKPEPADVVLLLKVLVLLDRQEKGSGERIIKEWPCKYLVVSFPTKSLSGRKKGMLEHYTKYFSEITDGEGWKIERILFENEVVFVVKK